MKLRWVAAIIFLVIGAASLAYAFNLFLTGDSGWQEIQANSSENGSCADEFVFLYNLGASGTSASAEYRALTQIYTDATSAAYRIFHAGLPFEDSHNLYYLNRHPNEIVEVDSALYRAFSLLESAENRLIYLGPVYETYNGLFFCQNDFETVDFDPCQNPELKDYFGEIAVYAKDPASVKLELLGGNKVRLKVSEAYLAFAQDNEFANFIDLSWMKNAFVADYLAQTLSDAGYTLGSLSSYDGFIRNLDMSGDTDYSFNIYDRQGQLINLAAVMHYSGALSLVSLRDYPMSSLDFQHYYTLASGEIRGPYLRLKDGMPAADTRSLIAYSKGRSCAEVLLEMLPAFFADAEQDSPLSAMADATVYAVCCADQTVYYTDSSLELTDLYQSADTVYTAVLTK